MQKEYDLVVIGTGAAGKTPALKCNAAGWNVAVADSQPFGGTCALRGCDPKKVLVGAAEIIERNRGLRAKGISGEVTIDWPHLMAFKRSFTEPVPPYWDEQFRKLGIDAFRGRVRFISRNEIRMDEETVRAKKIVLAAGSTPRKLGIPGEENLASSDQFLDLNELPRRIIFVGGGYISFEFAHIAAVAGAEVKILHKNSHPLNKFDPDLVKVLLKACADEGIEVVLNAAVAGIEQANGQYHVRAGNQTHRADLVVHGAGRVPDIEDMGLEHTGVETERHGITVNEYLQSVSNRDFYAAGDCVATGLPLTPVAGAQGSVIAENLLEGDKATFDGTATPSNVFTYPILASVGMLQHHAKEKNIHCDVNTGDMSSWYTARRIGLKHAAYKILIESKTRKILGAHILGYNADEIINIFALAIKMEMTADKLKQVLFTYPTASNDISYML